MAILTKAQVWASERMEILRWHRGNYRWGIGPDAAALDAEIQAILAGDFVPPTSIERITKHRNELARVRKNTGRCPLTGGRIPA